MTAEARIERYEQAYQDDYGYEAWLVRARRGATLAAMEAAKPRRVVEIGCGTEPLFGEAGHQADAVERWVTVEPADTFRRAAEALAAREPRLRVIGDFFERALDEVRDALGGDADFVVLDGLLHELPDPAAMLRAAHAILGPGGVLHVSVPNAFSLHRRLAHAMGLIEDVHALSARNVALEQARVYDPESLRAALEAAGFDGVDVGGHTIKPFTNAQMEAVEAALGPGVLDGLASLGESLPALAAEITADARRPS